MDPQTLTDEELIKLYESLENDAPAEDLETVLREIERRNLDI